MSEEIENPVEEATESVPTETPTDDGSANDEGSEAPRKGGFHPARLRILERENKVLMRRLDDVLARLEKKEEPAQEESIPEVDFEDDPLKAMHAEQRRIRMEIERDKAERKKRDEENEFRKNMTIANEAIIEFKEATPDYGAAIKHLSEIEFEEALEENPDLSDEEVDSLLVERLNDQKLKWIMAGKNPGEELYKRAKRRGYRAEAPKSAAEKKPDAKAEIADEKKRAQVGSSISRTPGRSSEGRVTASMIARMSEAEYREYADKLAKEKGRKLKFRDLAPDKLHGS